MGTQIKTENLTPGELELIQWQLNGDMGVYKTNLWEAITTADGANLFLLEKGYQSQVEAYRKFTLDPLYWRDVLVRAGLAPPLEPPKQPPTIDKPVEGEVVN